MRAEAEGGVVRVGEPSPSAREEIWREERYLALGPIELSFDELTVRAGGRLVPLTCMEFDTLAYLMRNAPRVVSQQELFSSVAGSVYQAQSSLMRVHVSNLRRKLGEHGQVIRTVRGRGFQFVGGADDAGAIADRFE